MSHDHPYQMILRNPRCRCGHYKLAHEHYRAGTDCAVCGCPRYRRRLWSPLRWYLDSPACLWETLALTSAIVAALLIVSWLLAGHASPAAVIVPAICLPVDLFGWLLARYHRANGR